MKKNRMVVRFLPLTLALLCLLATGCFMDKPLEQTSVQGTVYRLELKLPFAVQAAAQEIPLDTKTAAFMKKAQSYMERPTGENLHLTEFAVSTFNQENIRQEYGALDGEQAQQFYRQFGQSLTDSYLRSLTKAAGMTEVTTEAKGTTIDGRSAVVTTVQCKMKGEAETLKLIYIDDSAESWLIALAYPKEKQDGIGQEIEQTILPQMRLVK